MSSLVLTGDTSGSVTVTVPAVAGSNTATIGAATGTHYPFTQGTAVASTSGTSIDFTGIPAWVKRITVMFSGVSTSGTNSYLIQIGSGSFVTSGYDCSWIYLGSASGVGTSTVGFQIFSDVATDISTGTVRLVNMGGNLWMPEASQVVTTRSAQRFFKSTAGSLTLSGALDRVRITTVNGTDTFDAGSINILYE